jgi:LacI family transcriptional regulator
MATITEIAKETGLSVNTVSRILRHRIKGSRRDAVERSRQVFEVARRLGYRVNSSARAMKTGRFNAIALVQSIHSHLGHLAAPVWAGIHEAVLESNLHLIASRLPDELLGSGGFVPKILRELAVDGLLICYESSTPPEMLALIREHAIPSIWINVVQKTNAVRPDDVQAGSLAVQHLVKLGHKRIAFADFEHDQRFLDGGLGHYSQRYRYDGYITAMKEAGLKPRLITANKWRDVGAAEQPKIDTSWLEEKSRPTAIVSQGSWGLLRLAIRCEELFGSSKALSMITFESDVVNCEDLRVDVVQLPQRQMGRRAVAMLERRIESPGTDVPSEVLPCTLLTGFSTFPCP